MKLIPLPEGMVVKRKVHIGKNKFKMKLFQGYIRSVNSEEVHMQVSRETCHHYVSVDVATHTLVNIENCYCVEVVMN